jgi:hypothetical protein
VWIFVVITGSDWGTVEENEGLCPVECRRGDGYQMLKAAKLDRRIACALASCVIASGCVNPSEKIATSLTAYGLDASQSQCVGDRLEQDLSIGQLQELGRAARAYSQGDVTPGRLTASDLLRVAGQFKNPKVPIEVGKAAAGCGVLTG